MRTQLLGISEVGLSCQGCGVRPLEVLPTLATAHGGESLPVGECGEGLLTGWVGASLLWRAYPGFHPSGVSWLSLPA